MFVETFSTLNVMSLTIIMFFSNLTVHFLCTDVKIALLLLRLLRSFVKVKISYVQYCTLYTSASLQKWSLYKVSFYF